MLIKKKMQYLIFNISSLYRLKTFFIYEWMLTIVDLNRKYILVFACFNDRKSRVIGSFCLNFI